MFYSRFVFLAKLSELSTLLQDCRVDDDAVMDSIIENYVKTMYDYGVIDSKIKIIHNPVDFDDQATDIDKQWRSEWEDWDVTVPQYAMGISEDRFIVLLYRPSDWIITKVKAMDKYLEE